MASNVREMDDTFTHLKEVRSLQAPSLILCLSNLQVQTRPFLCRYSQCEATTKALKLPFSFIIASTFSSIFTSHFCNEANATSIGFGDKIIRIVILT
jgi:hypothetical protein